MNPILKENFCVPDVEARVMPDGRLYIYGSWDLYGNNAYCSHELHAFSTDDMENWVDHGVIFRNNNEWKGIPWQKDALLYAPDAIYRDGKYYLYVCGNGNVEGVAVADTPIGPFSVAEKIEGADGDGIDPAVFIDDDGQAYYFWGQFHLRGAKLNKDMKTLDKSSVKTHILTEWEHGFHEGASIRKIGKKYYMLFTDISRGKATCLSYAIADYPLGPYKKCGVIIDNVYCDDKTWNNHGSIACFKGQWYVFYHRSSQNSTFNRRVCVEKIEFDEKGYIKEVEQTSQGASKSINALENVKASLVCKMMGGLYLESEGGREVLTKCGDVHYGSASDWAEYKYLDFGGGATKFEAIVKGTGKIIVKIENDRTLAEIDFNTDDYATISAELREKVCGIHAVWLIVASGDFKLKSFKFKL